MSGKVIRRWHSAPQEGILPRGIVLTTHEVLFWRETESDVFERVTLAAYLEGVGNIYARRVLGEQWTQVAVAVRQTIAQEAWGEQE